MTWMLLPHEDVLWQEGAWLAQEVRETVTEDAVALGLGEPIEVRCRDGAVAFTVPPQA